MNNFFLGKPASINDRNNIDWLPTLNLDQITSDDIIVNELESMLDTIDNIEKHYIPKFPQIEFIKTEIMDFDEDGTVNEQPILGEGIEFIEVTASEVLQELKEEVLDEEALEVVQEEVVHESLDIQKATVQEKDIQNAAVQQAVKRIMVPKKVIQVRHLRRISLLIFIYNNLNILA